MRSLDVIELGLVRLQWLAAAAKFELAMRRHDCALKYGYDPNQLRDDHGRWTDAGGRRTRSGDLADGSPLTQVTELIRVCVVTSASRTIVNGIKTFRVTYECAGGRTFIREGFGHDFPGIVRDPFW